MRDLRAFNDKLDLSISELIRKVDEDTSKNENKHNTEVQLELQLNVIKSLTEEQERKYNKEESSRLTLNEC